MAYKDPEKKAAAQRERYWANVEASRAKAREKAMRHYRKNRDALAESSKMRKRKAYAENPDKFRKAALEFERRHREKLKPKKKEYRRQCRENLADWYVIEILIQRTGIRPGDIPKDMIEMKRLHLKIKRELAAKTTGA